MSERIERSAPPSLIAGGNQRQAASWLSAADRSSRWSWICRLFGHSLKTGLLIPVGCDEPAGDITTCRFCDFYREKLRPGWAYRPSIPCLIEPPHA